MFVYIWTIDIWRYEGRCTVCTCGCTHSCCSQIVIYNKWIFKFAWNFVIEFLVYIISFFLSIGYTFCTRYRCVVCTCSDTFCCVLANVLVIFVSFNLSLSLSLVIVMYNYYFYFVTICSGCSCQHSCQHSWRSSSRESYSSVGRFICSLLLFSKNLEFSAFVNCFAASSNKLTEAAAALWRGMPLRHSVSWRTDWRFPWTRATSAEIMCLVLS